MEIKRIRVENWGEIAKRSPSGELYTMSPWANSPTIRVLVDEIPKIERFIFDRKDTGTGIAYYSELDGYVRFMHHNPKDETGYGGSVFDIQAVVADEIQGISVKGPWSSSAAAMNSIGFGPCIDAVITDDEGVWARGWTFQSGALSLQKVRDFLRKNPPEGLPKYFELHFLLEDHNYTPMPCKPRALGRMPKHGVVISAPIEMEGKGNDDK